MKRKTAVKGLLFLLLGFLIVGVGWRYWPRERDLVKLSTPIMSLKGDDSGGVLSVVGWISDHEVLYGQIGRFSEYVSYRMQDTRTGAARPLTRLNDLLHQQYTKRKARLPYPDRLSPDRRWLLFSVDDMEWCAAPLDGSRFLRWSSYDANLWWRPDSQGFWGRDVNHLMYGLAFYPLSDLKQVEQFAVPNEALEFQYACVLQNGLLCVNNSSNYIETLTLTLLKIAQKNLIVHKRSVRMPRIGFFEGVESSLQGDRVAWRIRYYPREQVWPLLARFLPQQSGTEEDVIDLWVSRPDGTEMREVGEMKVTDTLDMRKWGWLPDGKHLWYEHDERLWRVPVP